MLHTKQTWRSEMPEETKQKSLFEKEISRKDFLRTASVVGGGVAVSVAAVTAARLSPPPETPTGKKQFEISPNSKLLK